VRVKDVMTTDLVVIRPEQTIREVAGVLSEPSIDSLPVVDEAGKLLGLVSKSDVLKAFTKSLDPNTPVSEIMTGNEVKVAHPEDAVEEDSAEISCLPVVYKEKLVGVCTRSNLTRAVIEKLQHVRDELFTIINSIHNPIVSIDNRGAVRVINRSAEKLLGKGSDRVIGKNVRAVFFTTKLLETLKTGKTETSQKIKLNDKYFISNRTPIVRDGKIVGAVAIMQDITELEEVSRELRSVKELNSELDAIIQSSFDGLFVTDSEGRVVRVNRAYERITGLNEKDLLGKTMEDMIEEGMFSNSASLLVLEKKEPVTIIQENRNGKVTLVTGNPVFDDSGEIFRVVTNVRDITELNPLKQELEQARGLTRHYEHQLQQLRIVYSGGKLVVNSDKMRALVDLVMRLAQVDSTILIQGESGVGKELIAETIHNNSPRKDGPFIKVNCGAIPENLLESELFGYEDGAFTGARKEGKIGLFELAAGGTLFLDEISELPLNLQVKLLRTIQEKEVTRVGGAHPIKVDIRIIAGSNRDLAAMVKAKKFREDLYYRLNVVPVYVPPLRERKEEIPALVAHFLNRFNEQYDLNKNVAPAVVDVFMNYDWPGNVRELENLIERLVVITPGDVITTDELPPYLLSKPSDISVRVSVADVVPLKHAIESVERQILEKAFLRFKSTRRVAKELGVNQSTVVRKAAKYNIAILDR